MNLQDVTMVQSCRHIASKLGHTLGIIEGPLGKVTCANIDRNHQVRSADAIKPHELHHKLCGNVKQLSSFNFISKAAEKS